MNQLRVSTNVIDQWPYHEFESYIKLLNEIIEAVKNLHIEEESSKNMAVVSGLQV